MPAQWPSNALSKLIILAQYLQVLFKNNQNAYDKNI